MPNWNGLVLTKKGQLLQAKVGTGIVLALTKMKLGSGVLPEGTSLEDLTDLVTPEQNVGIAAKEVLTDQKMCKISATITNVGLSAGYYVRELGVFANDPDDGEILYAVTSDSAPDYLPPEGGSTAVSQEFAVYISASNASDVEVSIDPGALATMGYVQLSINTHNEDPESHPDIREKITDDIAAHNKLVTAHPDLDFVTQLDAAADGIHYRMRNGSADKVIDIVSVGDIAFRYKLAPGWVKLNGATVKRSDYPRLVQFATDNGLWTSAPGSNPQLFGQGDGSTTMVLPDYRNRVIQGGDTVGVKSAGLPNITGIGYDAIAKTDVDAFNSSTSGAIGCKYYSNSRAGDGGTGVYNGAFGSLSFDASLSNSIYGKSDTVQPPAIVLIPQIKY